MGSGVTRAEKVQALIMGVSQDKRYVEVTDRLLECTQEDISPEYVEKCLLLTARKIKDDLQGRRIGEASNPGPRKEGAYAADTEDNRELAREKTGKGRKGRGRDRKGASGREGTTDGRSRQKPCPYFLMDNCSRGANCPDEHIRHDDFKKRIEKTAANRSRRPGRSCFANSRGRC